MAGHGTGHEPKARASDRPGLFVIGPGERDAEMVMQLNHVVVADREAANLALPNQGLAMEQENDIGYYRQREANARKLALDSSHAAIRRIHNDMADRYAARARELANRSLRVVGST